MRNCAAIKRSLQSGLQQFNPRVELSNGKVYLYVYGVDDMSKRQYRNLEAEIDAVCDSYGIYIAETYNGDEWCWVFDE